MRGITVSNEARRVGRETIQEQGARYCSWHPSLEVGQGRPQAEQNPLQRRRLEDSSLSEALDARASLMATWHSLICVRKSCLLPGPRRGLAVGWRLRQGDLGRQVVFHLELPTKFSLNELCLMP